MGNQESALKEIAPAFQAFLQAEEQPTPEEMQSLVLRFRAVDCCQEIEIESLEANKEKITLLTHFVIITWLTLVH